MLRMLEIKAAIVGTDAMGWQKRIADQIVKQNRADMSSLWKRIRSGCMKKLPCYLIAQNIINISEHHTSRPRKKSRTQEKQNPSLCRIRIMARNSRKGAGRLADGCKNDFYQRDIWRKIHQIHILYLQSAYGCTKNCPDRTGALGNWKYTSLGAQCRVP